MRRLGERGREGERNRQAEREEERDYRDIYWFLLQTFRTSGD